MAAVKPGVIDQTQVYKCLPLVCEALARHHMWACPWLQSCSFKLQQAPWWLCCSRVGVGKWLSLVKQLPDSAFLGRLSLKQTKEREPKHWLEFSLWQNNIFAIPFSSRIGIFTRWKISHFQPATLAGTRKHKSQQKPVHSTVTTAIECLVAVAARNTNTVTPDCWTARSRGLTNPF